MTTPSGTLSLDDGAVHTVREIAQQPALWREVDRIVSASRDSLDPFLRPLVARGDLRVVLTGAGTSAFAGQVLQPALARRLGRRVDAVATTDLVADPRGCLAEDVPTLLVSFARSGDSPESVAATALADQVLSEVHHLVITCNEQGRLAREHAELPKSHVLLMPPGSNDRGFAMTSSFTCMTLAALLALGGSAYDGVAERLARAAESITDSSAVDRTVGALLESAPERIVFLGSGPLKGLAEESALKVLELTGGTLMAVAESSLGFRHGPKAVLNDRSVAVVYMSNDPYTRKYDQDIYAELRGNLPAGSVVTVSADSGAGTEGTGTDAWPLPGLDGVEDVALALSAVVYAQLIALRASLARCLRPDNPFPSGEVNRVVQGVTLHSLHN
ncbi:tagatose-6-phosphate ketose isomerase [Streptomyces violaceusniger]|uniref:SIS domain-containing protein n=3 Tax=Streptomyces TaxID=1883 RepID=A0ABD5JNN3_9ACTN|nr:MULTISPECIES: SIS domain-containing protein [Streptomyces]KUL43667.1 tagatose-6-phosphate ketose isomerase [Streptomyces violaceusniger]MEE4590081.1 SIS domain-containing protein [Streptomyces sp. DSM 41602]